jgi:hypothetical protein
MDNVFSSGRGLESRRSLKSGTTGCSASLAVRMGYRADVERPLPEGQASMRRARRIPTSFYLTIDERTLRVSGDLSTGGALVLWDEQLPTSEVSLTIKLRENEQSFTARGEIVFVEMRGERFAHHIRFVQPRELRDLAPYIARAYEAGETRLHTL